MPYSTDHIRQNALDIRRRIDTAAGGRAVAFCAACKTQSAELLELCRDFDFDIFGENRAQELVRNFEAGAYGGKPAHFIGALQSNKVRDVVGRAELIHSVDSLRLMSLIDARAQKLGIVQNILIEINIGEEAGKSGIAPASADELLRAARDFPGICVTGLMAIPPKTSEIDKNEAHFQTLHKLFIDIKRKKYDNVIMDILSMGMSGDYEAAVRCGANLVRVGSALFGPRE